MPKILSNSQRYEGFIRKACVIFGSVFNNLKVRKYDFDGSVLDEKQKVEIVFSSKQDYYIYCNDLVRRNPSTTAEFSKRFPRMSYDLNGLNPDQSKQMTPWLNYTNRNTEKTIKAPAAYSFDFTLSLWCKDMDTSCQLLEQIIPYFKPELSVKVNEKDGVCIMNDVYITLNGISRMDNYQEGFNENRLIQWDINFTMYANVYAKEETSNLVNDVYISIHDDKKSFNEFTYDNYKVTVDSNGNKLDHDCSCGCQT